MIDGDTKQFVKWNTVLAPFNSIPHSGIAPEAFVSTVRTQVSFINYLSFVKMLQILNF